MGGRGKKGYNEIMTIKPARNPYGYRDLLVYQKADSLQSLCSHYTSHFPHSKTAVASNAELEEDFTDIWKGHYPELMGIKGIMGKGVKMGRAKEEKTEKREVELEILSPSLFTPWTH